MSDLNYGNHLANDRVLTLVHEARVAFFQSLNLSEMNIGNNTALIMADAAIQFKAEGFYGELIIIETALGEFSNKGFELYHRLLKKATGAELAIVKTGMVCFDYSTRSILKVPASFKELFD
jgi:acyl-CoA thioesterase FadM